MELSKCFCGKSERPLKCERVRLKSAAFEVKTGPSINGLVLMCAARSVDGKHDVDS